MVTPRGEFAVGRTSKREGSVAAVGSPEEWGRHFVDSVTISPSLLVKGTEEFRSMSYSQRRCLYPRERELKHFGPEYSQANCFLECSWELAAEKCKCVPWYLRELHPGRPLCERFGNACFEGVVEYRYYDGGDTCEERCPKECEFLQFKISLSTRVEYDHEGYCDGKPFLKLLALILEPSPCFLLKPLNLEYM